MKIEISKEDIKKAFDKIIEEQYDRTVGFKWRQKKAMFIKDIEKRLGELLWENQTKS